MKNSLTFQNLISGTLRFIFPVIISLSGIGLRAQSVKFYIQTDRDIVTQGETFMLEAVLENGDGNSIKLPEITPFKLLQGPSTTSSLSIINGARSSRMTYQYLLLATKKGKFTIPPASIKVGNKILYSSPVIIEVSGQNSTQSVTGNTNNTGKSFVRLELSEELAYIGQQIECSYVLYTRQNINSYQLLNEPDFEGFFVQPVQDIKEQPQRKTINGKEYYRQVLKKVILFPQKIGNYTFGPVNGTLDIPDDTGPSGFFFSDIKKENCVTNKVSLAVKNLPAGAPKSFSGSVGGFSMQTTINKSTFVSGEAIVLRMIIEGDGDSKIIQAPSFEIPAGFEKFEPSIIRDETFEKGDKIKILKEFEYILIASKDTICTIKPEFTFFSPTSSKYEKIETGPYKITILKGNGNISKPLKKELINDQLSPPSDKISFTKRNISFWASPAYFEFFGLIIALTILIIGFKYWKIRKEKEKEYIANQSENIALKHLEKANTLKLNKNFQDFYEEISRATNGYLKEKYNIQNIDSGLFQMTEYLRSVGISEFWIDEYAFIQKQCEMAKFAGQYGDTDLIYTKAESLLRFFSKTVA